MHAFERFSGAAKLTLTLAQEEAERAGHGHIGTEHLVLALRRDPESLAAQVLDALGVDEAQLREGLAAVLNWKPDVRVEKIVPTSRMKKVIEIAFDESTRARRSEVTTGDLLVAVVAEGEGLGAQALAGLGVRLADVRVELARLNLAGASERSSGFRVRPAGRMAETRAIGEGTRVLVHDPEPPHRLWEGRVVAASEEGFEIEVPDRPAGTRVKVEPRLIHPIPSGPTFLCEYCRAS